MKSDGHPKYYPDATANCSCGAIFVVGSTNETLTVEICSNCHPFYTGTEKIIDTAGRVEKFKRRRAVGEATPKKEKKARGASK